jgi:hypothetical protein
MSHHAMHRALGRCAAILLGAFGLGILPWQLAAADLPAVQATAANDIVIDGKLDEAGWRDGQWFADFEEVGTGDAPSVKTQAAIRFDAANLYYGVICHEPEIGKLKMVATERDKRVWGDDCVELFLDVTGKRTDYVHVIVNPKGTVYDARHTGGGERKDVGWNADTRVATKIGDDRWTVEMAMPLADLGLGWHSRTGRWSMLATRVRRTQKDAEMLTHIPGGGFHNPKSYGDLELQDAKLEPYIWKFPGLPETMVWQPKPDAYRCELRWALRNLTGSSRTITCRATLTGLGEPVSNTIRFGPRTGTGGSPFKVELPVTKLGDGILELTIADVAAPDTILLRRRTSVTLDHDPLVVTVTQPFYRNNIYATETVDAVRATGILRIPETMFKEPRPVRAALVRKGGNADASLAKTTSTATESTFDLELSIPGLPVGDYELVTSVDLPDGRTIADRQPLRKLPASGNEWRVDRSLRLLRNGKPVWPFGVFGFDMQRDAEAEGVAVTFYYHTANKPVEKVRELLDRAAARGMYLLLDPYHWRVYRKNMKKPLTDEEADLIRQRMKQIGDHPALMGWYSCDEPDLGGASHERLLRVYNVVRDADPYHPVFQLPAYTYGVHDFADTCDIIMPDPYPRFLEGGKSAIPLNMTTDYMAACRKASAGRKPWWVVPQAFEWAGLYVTSRSPNLTELRCQQLQGFIGGARGLLWFTDRHRANSVDLALGLPFLGQEAGKLREAVLAPEIPDGVKVEAPEEKLLHAAARKVGEHWFILTVNTHTDDQPAVTLTVPGLTVNTLFVVSENRTIDIAAGGTFSDDFGRFSGHIYTTDPASAFGPTVAAVYERIEAAKADLVKPGNLAHRSTGATLEVSSRVKWNAHAKHLHDGHDGMPWNSGKTKDAAHIQVNLPKPTPVARCVLLGSNVKAFHIQCRNGGKWVTACKGTNRPGRPLNVVFPPQEADAVRFVFDEPKEGCRATEIELYDGS